MAAYQLLLNAGERTVPAGTASLLVNVSPVIIALAAAALLGERMTRAALGRASAIAFGGVSDDRASTGAAAGCSSSPGALLVLGAAVVQAAFFVGSEAAAGALWRACELTRGVASAAAELPLHGGCRSRRASRAPSRRAAPSALAVAFSALGASGDRLRRPGRTRCAHIDVSIAAVDALRASAVARPDRLGVARRGAGATRWPAAPIALGGVSARRPGRGQLPADARSRAASAARARRACRRAAARRAATAAP